MLGIFITIFTFILIIISLFMILVVLMQRANTNAGMGAAFGGGVADSAFGADTTNVLTRTTKWAATAFFLIAAVLYLMYIRQAAESEAVDETLPAISVESAPSVEEAPIEAETTTPAVDAPSTPVSEETAPAATPAE